MGRTDPPVVRMEPNVVSLLPMLANLRLETSAPVKSVPVNAVPKDPTRVPVVVVPDNREPPVKSRSTVVRRHDDPVFLPERPAVRSLPFLMTR